MSIFSDAPITWTADTVNDDNCFNLEIHEKMDEIDTALTTVNAALTARLPAGVIVMWSGSIVSIPTGWLLCNGNFGTPNLQDRFIVAAGSAYAVAATGGEATHTLITAEMPAHTHTQYNQSTINNLDQGTLAIKLNPTLDENTGSTGGDGAHENRPPYFALAYIMKS